MNQFPWANLHLSTNTFEPIFQPSASSLDNIFNGLLANSVVVDSIKKNHLVEILFRNYCSLRQAYCIRLNPAKLATLKLASLKMTDDTPKTLKWKIPAVQLKQMLRKFKLNNPYQNGDVWLTKAPRSK